MSDEDVIVYISEDSRKCEQLLTELDELKVNYETKNVTKHRSYMKELQNAGIFGTPATFIGDEKTPILGLQKNKIRQALDLELNDW